MAIKIEGLKELEKNLEKLSRAAGKRAVRKALTTAALPVVDAIKSNINSRTGNLAKSIIVGTKLNKNQKRHHQKEKDAVEIHIGSTAPHAHLVEYGHGGPFAARPHPFMRPAWLATQDEYLQKMSDEMWAEITKAVGRAAKRAAKGKK